MKSTNIYTPTKPSSRHSHSAFTIVELLVVIIVIAILAAISLVAYTGVSQQAASASLQSDLSGASTTLKAFQAEKGNFPATISTDCGTSPDTNTNKCLKASPGNTYVGYSVSNSSVPKTFQLIASNSPTTSPTSLIYKITSESSPAKLASTMQPDVTPGASLELHAAKANGGLSQGINSPLTTTWTDTSGNGNNGTLTNFSGTLVSGWDEDGAGPHIVGDGDLDAVIAPPISMGLGDFTAEAWFKMPNVVDNYGYIIGAGNPNATNPWWSIFVYSDGIMPRWRLGVSPSGSGSLTKKAVPYDTWFHFVVTWDRDGDAVGYYNGIEYHRTSIAEFSSIDSQVISTDRTALFMYGMQSGGWTSKGACALARTYPFALSATQVAANYNAGADW